MEEKADLYRDHRMWKTVNDFSIDYFSYLCSNIPSSPAYVVYISQRIRYARACSSYDQFLNRGRLLTNKLMLHGFYSIVLCQHFAISTVIITIWFANTTLHWVECCLMCFITFVRPFRHTAWFWQRITPSTWLGHRAYGGCDLSTEDTYSS
jgi:hypothetical protein